MIERREHDRLRHIFLPACFEYEDVFHVGVIRDMSSKGIGVQSDFLPRIGETVHIQWGNCEPLAGRVQWTLGNRFGINVETDPLEYSRTHPYRSVRVPVGLPGEIHIAGSSHLGEILNMSTKGIAVSHSGSLRKGQLASVSFGNENFENCTVRWSRDGMVGLSLDQTVRLQTLSEIIDGAQSYMRAAA
ncbi:PilZ domain-containing protein [Qipengyuania marisflavi]|uniref:PilZ domain-containing protein n=1 Tax=Qipengyuania marisflavi TaxID=2486356 RepID=A0A5S3PYX2_9SPHN|nr:PilZ domain-containing protein [Qipengyuania marisflavi]TMM49016.1 PilZ domain-containing protein [Qipengyuania marisflavi]